MGKTKFGQIKVYYFKLNREQPNMQMYFITTIAYKSIHLHCCTYCLNLPFQNTHSETILAQLQISKEHRINEVSLLLGKKNNLPNIAWKPNILVANFLKPTLLYSFLASHPLPNAL